MSAEQIRQPLKPFSVNKAGRLAITSLNVPEVRPEEWKVVEGLSLGMQGADAVAYAGIDSDNPAAYSANILTRKFKGGPFAVRLGVELGQVEEPHDPESRVTLRDDQTKLLDLLSRRVTVTQLAARDDYVDLKTAKNRLYGRTARLCNDMGAENINNAVRLGFRCGIFLPVDAEQAREHYKKLFIAKRMRDFLQMAYPRHQLDALEDRQILKGVENLGSAWTALTLHTWPAILEGKLSEKIEQFRQWLDGVEPAQLMSQHNTTQSKIWSNRKALAAEFGRYIQLGTLIPYTGQNSVKE